MIIHRAIYAICPSAVTIRGLVAYDENENVVKYDAAEAEAKTVEMLAQVEAEEQAQTDARQSALNKLMALGLTEEEALALGIKP